MPYVERIFGHMLLYIEAKKQLKYNKREDVSFDVDVLDLRISKGGGTKNN